MRFLSFETPFTQAEGVEEETERVEGPFSPEASRQKGVTARSAGASLCAEGEKFPLRSRKERAGKTTQRRCGGRNTRIHFAARSLSEGDHANTRCADYLTFSTKGPGNLAEGAGDFETIGQGGLFMWNVGRFAGPVSWLADGCGEALNGDGKWGVVDRFQHAVLFLYLC